MRHGLLGCLLLLVSAAQAHEVRPAYLSLVADEEGEVEMVWKLPVLDGRIMPLEPRLPAHCVVDDAPPDRIVTSDARLERVRFRCGEVGLRSGDVAIDGLALTIMDVLVRVERPGEDPVTRLLRPEQPTLALDDAGSGLEIAAYLALGVEHILLGFDHLAFVLGLVVLVRGRWLLVQTITAFTVAHSITLGLSTVGLARASSAPVETVIALSILLLALEIVGVARGRSSLVARKPWLVAFGFGLLHGFGFAGALAELGLPEDAVPLALLLFNVGVELGQLLFVASVLLLAVCLRRAPALARSAPMVAAYVIGVPAAYWSIERLAGILFS